MTDTRLRDVLEAESRRVSLPPGAAERMFERGDRRERRRRVVTTAEGLAIAAGIVALIVTALPRGNGDGPTVTGPSAVAGAYVTRLPERDPDVARLGLAGRYELRLSADGSMLVLSPPDVYVPGPPIGFSVAGRRFTTDLFVGQGCEVLGTYRWSRAANNLLLVPVEEPCEQRSVILATGVWVETPPAPSPDALQGEWRAAFTCDDMVTTVEAAAVSRRSEAFWREAKADELGSPDPEDPCAGSPPLQTHTLRFIGERLQIFDQGPAEGFDGRYTLEGDILTIRDPLTRNIDGAYRLAVEVQENSLRFRLLGRGATDPWFLSAWQVAPFERIT